MEYIYLTIVPAILLFAWILDRTNLLRPNRIDFRTRTMPRLEPIPIDTKNTGYWKGIWIWLTKKRLWKLSEDWEFRVRDELYVIPKGFITDGASIPKVVTFFFNPTGILLMGAIIHDYLYIYGQLNRVNGGRYYYNKGMADKLFRDICIEVNGFKTLNYIAWIAVKMGGRYHPMSP